MYFYSFNYLSIWGYEGIYIYSLLYCIFLLTQLMRAAKKKSCDNEQDFKQTYWLE